MRISAWGAALLSLAACAGWEKPGATGAERQAALGRCEAAGRQIPPSGRITWNAPATGSRR
ncbi:hypothetical protein [Teichococcus aestuarii]|uniref:hypothetical protein n=1 Tax=Teichococcus aestuarii TaxID=568898 RepID=UPI00361E57E9